MKRFFELTSHNPRYITPESKGPKRPHQGYRLDSKEQYLEEILEVYKSLATYTKTIRHTLTAPQDFFTNIYTARNAEKKIDIHRISSIEMASRAQLV